MPRLRVHNLATSLDGYAAGPAQDVHHPLGRGAEDLHSWMWKTRTGRAMIGQDGGDEGVDDRFMRAWRGPSSSADPGAGSEDRPHVAQPGRVVDRVTGHR